MNDSTRLEGTYRAVALPDTIQFGQAKNGSDQVACDLSLEDVGETVTVILSFAGGAKPYSQDKMKAMGFRNDGGTLRHERRECTARVFYEEWEGEERMRVDVVTSKVALKPMDEPQKRAFMSELLGALR
jgi:hypothetical protein